MRTVMLIAKILKRPTLNTEEINKTLDKMSVFINTSIESVNEDDEYIIVIDKDIKAIVFYDKIRSNLYYDRNTLGKGLEKGFPNNTTATKNGAVERFFKEKYPKLIVKKVTSKVLTTS